MSYLSPALTLLVAAVKKAGQSLTRDFNEVEKLQASVRGSADFANSAVARAERVLRQELSRRARRIRLPLTARPNLGAAFVVSAMEWAKIILPTVFRILPFLRRWLTILSR